MKHPEAFKWFLIGHNYPSSFEKETKPFQIQRDFEIHYWGVNPKDLYSGGSCSMREEREEQGVVISAVCVPVSAVHFCLCGLAGLSVGLHSHPSVRVHGWGEHLFL